MIYKFIFLICTSFLFITGTNIFAYVWGYKSVIINSNARETGGFSFICGMNMTRDVGLYNSKDL
jgi:hypothetical protein